MRVNADAFPCRVKAALYYYVHREEAASSSILIVTRFPSLLRCGEVASVGRARSLMSFAVGVWGRGRALQIGGGWNHLIVGVFFFFLSSSFSLGNRDASTQSHEVK